MGWREIDERERGIRRNVDTDRCGEEEIDWDRERQTTERERGEREG